MLQGDAFDDVADRVAGAVHLHAIHHHNSVLGRLQFGRERVHRKGITYGESGCSRAKRHIDPFGRAAGYVNVSGGRCNA